LSRREQTEYRLWWMNTTSVIVLGFQTRDRSPEVVGVAPMTVANGAAGTISAVNLVKMY